jgi:small conductance mechanosensitive channel
MRKSACLGNLILWLSVLCALASDGNGLAASPPRAQTPSTEDARSTAERIARLQGALQTAKKQLEDYQARLQEPDSEYNQALKEFQDLDTSWRDTNARVEELLKQGKKAEADDLQVQGLSLQERREIASDRLTLAVAERKELQQKVKSLPEQIRQNQQALDELLGLAPHTATPKRGAGDPKTVPANSTNPPGAPGKTGAEAPAPASAQPATPGLLPTGVFASSAAPSTTAPSAAPAKPSAEDRKIKKAQKEVETRQEAAAQAESEVRTIAKRLEVIGQSLTLDQQRLQTARAQVELYQKSVAELEKQQQSLKAAGKAEAAAGLQGDLDQSRDRLSKAQQDVRTISAGLAQLQQEQADLQKDQERARQQASQKVREARDAEQALAELQNPFTLRNLLAWAVSHGPQVLVIVVGMVLLHFLVRLVSRQIVRMLGHHGKRCTLREAENRARTLAAIFTNLGSVVVLGGGSLMILDAVGIPIVPLMGGAAVVGLAVAFGAQNLIRDYFTGFMVLLEDQYAINDVVKIGEVSGLVERITLRMTVLRDQEGVAHFIPHGTITTVSNLTHGWSVAMFKIAIAYGEDVDVVIQTLTALTRELRQEPDFKPLILDDPEMQGVDSFDANSVTIKFLIKTRPLKQWPVRRELLRRIKKRFDELGINMVNSDHSNHPPLAHEPPVPVRAGGTESGSSAQAA